MLKFFNRLEKTRNFFILIFAILMVVSLVFWNRSSIGSTTATNLAQSEEAVASVSGNKITIGELIRQKENYSRFSRGQSFPAKMMLDGLIGSRIARVEAERLGLTASDAEVATELRSQFKSEDGKPFDQAKYEQNVIEQFGNIAAYEQSVRDDISSRKLDAYITSGVTVSEEEVLNDYQRKNTKFDLSYVAVNSSDLAKTIKPTDQELKDYFEKNKQSYYISVPQKKIRYVFVNTNKIGEKLQISDADLRAEYDKLTPDKKVAGVLGQEIVLRVAKPDLDGQVQGKANELVQQLKKDGGVVSEAAFADLAKGHSENPATAPSGGKLSGPVHENTQKPDDPYQRLLKMKPGEVTEPISYQSRYFILRRGEDVAKTFEAAKKELEVSLRNRRAYSVALDGHPASIVGGGGRRLQVQHRSPRVAEVDSLITRRQKAAGPIARAIRRQAVVVAEHDIRRQVLVLAAQRVADPGSDRRPAGDDAAGVNLPQRLLVIVVLGVH